MSVTRQQVIDARNRMFDAQQEAERLREQYYAAEMNLTECTEVFWDLNDAWNAKQAAKKAQGEDE